MRVIQLFKAHHCIAVLLLVMMNKVFSQQEKLYSVTALDSSVVIFLSPRGEMVKAKFGNGGNEKNIVCYNSIEGFDVTDSISMKKLFDGGLQFEKNLISTSGMPTTCIMTERFVPSENSIRWECVLKGDGTERGLESINTTLKYPISETSRFWTTWEIPFFDSSKMDANLLRRVSPPTYPGNVDYERSWQDPLVPMPLTNQTYYYGGRYLRNSSPALNDGRKNIFAVPFFSIFDEAGNIGLTIALSPEDNIIDLTLRTTGDGLISFSRIHNRLPKDRTIRMAVDIVSTGTNWREGFGWYVNRYKEYFYPKTKDAFDLNGGGAYSSYMGNLDADKLKKMAFSVNWMSSFDFPYMGMFLPDVGIDYAWNRLGGGHISLSKINDYAGQLRREGFYLLNYFNVTEFGADIKYSPKSNIGPILNPDGQEWRSPNKFLFGILPRGILKVPQNMETQSWRGVYPGGVFYTWMGAVAMDCGDKTYQDFLLSQAKRHIDFIPNSSGICIDRTDWLRMFNLEANDGISWYDGRPARSLINSWKETMGRLGKLMHENGKNIFVNDHLKRIDIMKESDGIFSEDGNHHGATLNLAGFLAVKRPAINWTQEFTEWIIKEEGIDNFFHRHLYMGVFPMSPFPGNDHSILPGEEIEKYYLDYGKVFNLLKYRTWILRAVSVDVKNNAAKANIFYARDGYVIPVVFAEKDIKNIQLSIRGLDFSDVKFGRVYLPGEKDFKKIKIGRSGKELILDVPLERGCALIHLKD